MEIRNITPKFVAEKTSKAGKQYWAITLRDSTEGLFTYDMQIASTLRTAVGKEISIEVDGSKVVGLNQGKAMKSQDDKEFHLSIEQVRSNAFTLALNWRTTLTEKEQSAIDVFFAASQIEKWLLTGETPKKE